MTTQQDALQDLVRISEELGLYDGEFNAKGDRMKELTDIALLHNISLVPLYSDDTDHAYIRIARAAIAADRALNAECHDPLTPKQLEVIADPTLRAVCEAYTNTPGGHFVRLQAVAKLVAAAADRDVMRQAPEGWKLVPIEPTLEMLRAGVEEQHGPATYKSISHAGCSTMEGDQYANYRAMLAAAPTPPAEQQSTEAAPKLKGSPFESYVAQLLHAAWIDGWASCRDAEFAGDDAMNEAFNQCVTLNTCMSIEQATPAEPLGDDELSPAYKTPEELIAALDSEDAPPAEQGEQEPVAWWNGFRRSDPDECVYKSLSEIGSPE